MPTAETPKGVVAILLNDEGRTIASVTDFDTQSYGGFKLVDAQRHRVRTRLANEMVLQMSIPDFAKAMRGYDAERLMDQLVSQHGYRISVVEIGWNEEPSHANR